MKILYLTPQLSYPEDSGGKIKTSNFLHLRLLSLYEWIKYSIYEKIMYHKFTHVFCISEKDNKILKKIIDDIDITVLQLKLIIKHYKHNQFKKNIMLYVGNLFWLPNRDGIRWLIKNIYPFLRKQIPTLQLWIIGKTPKYIKYLQHESIKYLGYINDVSKYINKSKFCIVPILYGTGIRIKILEAFSWGLPVISTPEGIIGLDLHHRKELLIAKDKTEFFRYIKLLLLSKNESLHIIENSKKYLKSKFNEKK